MMRIAGNVPGMCLKDFRNILNELSSNYFESSLLLSDGLYDSDGQEETVNLAMSGLHFQDLMEFCI